MSTTPEAQPDDLLSIGEVAKRSGLKLTALRFYEQRGLISSQRNTGNQRRYQRDVLRRLAVIQAAQKVGFTLAESADMLAPLPHDAAPDAGEWAELSRSWRPMLDDRIATLERLRDQLDACIGCGCLSLALCAMANPGDRAAQLSDGAAYWKRRPGPPPHSPPERPPP